MRTVLSAGILVLSISTLQADISIRVTADGKSVAITGTGSSQNLIEELAVYVDKTPLASTTEVGAPLLGEFTAENQLVRFTPRFPLSSRVAYALRIPDANKKGFAYHKFQLPATDPPAKPRVMHIYPSSARLPENVLKFYIRFSAPMNRGDAYSHITLYDGDQPVESPFLELGEELWDRQQQRFTLLLHPGRIKRGLRPHDEDGQPISSGRQFTLEVRDSWKSAEGAPLAQTIRKQFTATGPDHEGPDPGRWKIEIPAPETKQPISLVFNEPLDAAMLDRVLQVVDYEGKIVTGQIQISALQDKWSFVPDQPWPRGKRFSIVVDTMLEDLCGNSIARPFETKLQVTVTDSPPPTIAIEFDIKR